MAAPQLITIDNFSTLLVESTQGRSGTPDGNVFFDQANDLIEVITREELAQVDLGSGAEDNPLTDYDGITAQALYAFERARRGANVNLREFRPGLDGSFKFAGAFIFQNGVKLAGSDRTKIRGSGLIEQAANGATDRIYFGARSLNNIEATSQPFYQLADSTTEADLQAATPVDFSRQGPIDEMIQVFGTTANGDAGAGDFDDTGKVLVIKVRTFGQTQGETTSILTGVAELNGFSTGFGIGEGPSPSSAFTAADVFGGSAVAPFDAMTYERFGAPQTQTGFTSGSADFTDVIGNPTMGSLAEVRAYLDALMQQDTDQDAGAGTYLPKRGDPLYTIDAAGRLVTRQGLYIDNLPESDRQNIVQTDDSGTSQTYPFNVDIRVSVSDAWQGDPNAWYQCMFVDGSGGLDFETSSAVIVEDADSNQVVGTPTDVVGSAGSYEIRFSFAYDTNTQAGLSAATDKQLVFLAEGDGGAQAAEAIINVPRQAIVTASAQASAETNL